MDHSITFAKNGLHIAFSFRFHWLKEKSVGDELEPVEVARVVQSLLNIYARIGGVNGLWTDFHRPDLADFEKAK